MTPKRALISYFQALVNIFANLHGARSKSIATSTLETANDINASPVPANIRVTYALVIIDTFLPAGIQDIADRTITPERPIGVYTITSIAYIRHKFAFVDIATSFESSGTFRAKFKEFIRIFDGTSLAISTPSFAFGATAFLE